MALALSCLRAFFIVLSVCYVLVGLAGSIGSGVFIYVFKGTPVSDLFKLSGKQELFSHLQIGLIVVASAFAIMIVAGFVGCCAMCRRRHNQCCQDVLAFFALIITLAFTAAVILLAVFRNQLRGDITASFEINMQSYDNTEALVETAVAAYVDSTQQSQQCCGSSGYESWQTLSTSWAAAHPGELAPTSCCFRPEDAFCNKQQGQIYQRGCSSVIGDISSDVFTIIYVVGAVIALVSLIEMLTACYMARTSDRGQQGCCC